MHEFSSRKDERGELQQSYSVLQDVKSHIVIAQVSCANSNVILIMQLVSLCFVDRLIVHAVLVSQTLVNAAHVKHSAVLFSTNMLNV